jgi:CelD/BcsL family acetyltransferase involved in cellulose biosynthesis
MTANIIDNSTSFQQYVDKGQYGVCSVLSDIEKMSNQWNRLLAASRCNKAFGSLEWYVASCRVQSSSMPYLVWAGHGAEIDCIVPLVLDRKTGVASFPHYANDYNDVLVRDDQPIQVANLLKYAISPHSACRRLVLSKLRPDSDCLRGAIHVKDEPGIEYRHENIDAYSYVELPPSFDNYLESLGRKFRKNTRRALRALEANALSMRELSPDNFDPMELPHLFFHLFLSRHSGEGLFQHEEAQGFAREVLPPMFRKGNLRVFAMFEGESIIAVLLWFATNKGCLAWNAGFLKGKEQWSPGTSLYAFAIQRAISAGLRELDFGEGDEAYKSHWARDSYRVSELIVARR